MNKRAFTMVELIFVIVILGILAAVAVPRLNASREDAKRVQIITDIATVFKDIESYYIAKGSFDDGPAIPNYSPYRLDISQITNVPLRYSGQNLWYYVDDKPCFGYRAYANTYYYVALANRSQLCNDALTFSNALDSFISGVTNGGDFINPRTDDAAVKDSKLSDSPSVLHKNMDESSVNFDN